MIQKQVIPAYIRKRRAAGFLFFLPALLFLIVFLVGPMLTAVFFSFTRYTIINPPTFRGFRNYQYIFTLPRFWNSIQVTFVYVVTRVLIVVGLGLFIALVLNQKVPLSGFFQSIYFLPYVFPLAVTSIMWRYMFRPFSLVEQLTSIFGIGPVPWLSDGRFALSAVTISTIWSGVGYYSILLLAGLQTIPKDTLEAALIDGAGWWQRLFRVILPLLKPTLFYVIVVAMIGSIQGFAAFLVLTGGGPGDATRVLGLLIYEYGFSHLQMGVASAMSIVLFAIILGFTMLQHRIQRYEGM
jgi:ABC-type sugar transport system permease subunit